MPPASMAPAPCCCRPMVPMTTGPNIPSSELLAPWPSPANLPTAPASAVCSGPPSSDASICDPRSTSEVWPPAPSMLANLPSVLVSCFAASASFCAPPGCAAMPLNPASSAGTAAPMAGWTLLRFRPSAVAMRPIMSGVRNCITSETRLVAMGSTPSANFFSTRLSKNTRYQVRWRADQFFKARVIFLYDRCGRRDGPWSYLM